MDEKRMNEILALCNKATPGPIQVNRFDDVVGIDYQLQRSGKESTVLGRASDADGNWRAMKDAELWAQASTVIPELIKAIKVERSAAETAIAKWLEDASLGSKMSASERDLLAVLADRIKVGRYTK